MAKHLIHIHVRKLTICFVSDEKLPLLYFLFLVEPTVVSHWIHRAVKRTEECCACLRTGEGFFDKHCFCILSLLHPIIYYFNEMKILWPTFKQRFENHNAIQKKSFSLFIVEIVQHVIFWCAMGRFLKCIKCNCLQ